ncbi:MAG: type I DNA topoisomerase [Nitrospinota bacterium]|nr:type I DNA topoisomerase [Nitrospinota bacterium]
MAEAKKKAKKTTSAKKSAKSASRKQVKNLVIVESPAKANTIRKYLGRGFDVKASIGHIRDLPKSKLGIDVENGFALQLVTIKGKASVIKELKAAAKGADNIYLAPDPDREGEAIAQHINDVIDTKGQIYRIQFNEITKKAITEAIEHPLTIDVNRVQAQQARRALDRIVGYKLSPLLWEKVRRGLSAGRVQSVALRVLVDRENEITAFVPREYWTVTCKLKPNGKDEFDAKLFHTDGKKFELDNGADAQKTVDEIKKEALAVTTLTVKDKKRNAPAPFITSTLQQAASQRFRYSASRTMRLAQRLYEGEDIGHDERVGLITYMRTDSTRTATEALEEVRGYITETMGKDFLPEAPNTFKVKKSAQEGHEAIRPTSVLRTPASLKDMLQPEEYKVYDLIWKRFVASQMSPAIINTLSVDINAGRHLLRASGSNVKFEGYLKVYKDDDKTDKDDESVIPNLEEGERLALNEITPNQHFTQPPPRYSEATLIKELEDKGIGRPSTYASIMSTIIDRDYAELEERRLWPTELGKLITEALVLHFPAIMDIGFTAQMEENLDEVEGGRKDWVSLMNEYYTPFVSALEKAGKEMKNYKIGTEYEEKCDKCGKEMEIKYGRFGQFLACTGYPECKSTRQIGKGAAEPVKTGEKCHVCGDGEFLIKSGKFGKFIACSNYPECKTTKPFTLGIKCPKDGCIGEIAERKSKKGRSFYGCTKYPDCDFTSWEKPFDLPCEVCGSKYLVFARKIDNNTIKLKCPNKECDFTRQKHIDESKVNAGDDGEKEESLASAGSDSDQQE